MEVYQHRLWRLAEAVAPAATIVIAGHACASMSVGMFLLCCLAGGGVISIIIWTFLMETSYAVAACTSPEASPISTNASPVISSCPSAQVSTDAVTPANLARPEKPQVLGGCFSFLAVRKRLVQQPRTVVERSDDDEIHLKYCGWRKQDPSPSLPRRSPFSLKPFCWENLQGELDSLYSSAAERELTLAFGEAISDIDGPKDPVTLLRFLRARPGDVSKATEMYRSAMERRVGSGLEKAFRLDTIDDSLHRRYDPYWRPIGFLGFDRDGDPIVWESLGSVPISNVTDLPTDFVLRHEVYSQVRLQKALEELMLKLGRPVMYVTVVEDLTGLGLHHCKPKALKAYYRLVRFSEDTYPELVKRALVIRAPMVFETFWRIVKKFFDKGTRDKVHVVAPSTTFSTLTEFIDRKWIPECYGGDLRIGYNAFCEPVLPRPTGELPESLAEDIWRTWAGLSFSERKMLEKLAI